MSIEHRRSFLQKMGIMIPAVVEAGLEYGGGKSPAPGTMTAEEIFTTFVSEALFLIQQQFPVITTDKGSTVRALFEAQGAALALVLSELQKRGAHG